MFLLLLLLLLFNIFTFFFEFVGNGGLRKDDMYDSLQGLKGHFRACVCACVCVCVCVCVGVKSVNQCVMCVFESVCVYVWYSDPGEIGAREVEKEKEEKKKRQT